MGEPMPNDGAVTVFLADDSALIRAGVRAMLDREHDIVVVGVAEDYDSFVAEATAAAPQVLVTDIRMPPSFQREGIDGAMEVRKRHPGTGIVVLSNYDDPDYAITLLTEGSAGTAYLLKDRVAEGDQLARAVREVAMGGSMLDPQIVDALMRPVAGRAGLSASEEELLADLANGRSIKAIAVRRNAPPGLIADRVESLFRRLAEGASHGDGVALRRLRSLHEAIVDREEQGETLARLLPAGVVERVRTSGLRSGEVERLTITVLMSDIRGYTTIAELADPGRLAQQLHRHRATMNRAILDCGGTVMQYVGDAVMAVFGAPEPRADHADAAVAAAAAMHVAQRRVNDAWRVEGLPPFEMGIGLSTGEVAAALLGSDERLEYTVVGDAVNLCQRLQQLAGPGETVCSEPTWDALTTRPAAEPLPEQIVKGRTRTVRPWKISGEGAA
jgi:adenylate cyclase